jgi:hypothetical protein
MEVDSNLNTTVTMTTMTTLMYPVVQDPQARCNVPLLHVYVQVYSLVWACLCLKFYWMFYLEIKRTLVILWSNFIPLKINDVMNNIYLLVLIICAILSLSSWPLIPLTTITKPEIFRFPKRVWSQGFRIRDSVPAVVFTADCCENSQEPTCSIKGAEFLEYLSEYQLHRITSTIMIVWWERIAINKKLTQRELQNTHSESSKTHTAL